MEGSKEMTLTIINEFNKSNSSKYKISVMEKYKADPQWIKIFQMAYDRVRYTFGITLKNVPRTVDKLTPSISLEEGLNRLEKLSTREYTGNSAIDFLTETLQLATEDDELVLRRIINRDLRINLGPRQFNKIVDPADKCISPAYMRCGLYNEKSAKKISWPAVLQLKADGTYREVKVQGGKVFVTSRSGEPYDYPFVNKLFGERQRTGYKVPDGHYFGELTVVQDGQVLDRATGNGLIGSDNPPMDDIVFDVWDYVPLDQYEAAVRRDKKHQMTPYSLRLADVRQVVDNLENDQIRLIETVTVENIGQAMTQTSQWMAAGMEGGIIKDVSGVFKDGTSPHQLKVKTEIEVDVRVTGFLEGTIGTKREATFGSMTFETDDGKIKGRVSGFTDAQLEDYNSRREELIGTVITVLCTDITKGRDNDYWALSNPRFVELRLDRTETDTFERAWETREMAFNVGAKC